MDKHQAGLFNKFIVKRVDGKDKPWQKHDGCDYFVLDLTHDPHALPALKSYADSCESEYPNLAEDLRKKLPVSAPSPAQGTPEPPEENVSKYSRADLEKYYRWQAESLKSFRDKFGVESNCQALDAIDALLAGPQNGQGWVFTSSGKLPESRTWVNVCTEHDGQRNVVPAFGVRLGNDNNRWRWECEFEVIAWQPLPAPPTGDARTEL